MSDESVPLSLKKRVDQACDRFEKAWKDRQGPRIQAYLAEVPEPERAPLLRELLALEIELRRNVGETPTPEEYLGRFPEHIELIHAAFANVPGDAASNPPGSGERPTTPLKPPTESATVDAGPPFPSGPPPIPDHIGRYKVIRRLGGGSYGDVYLAHDTVMDRQVAVKVPTAKLVATERAREEFLREARCVARLQHEGIVRAHDFGQETDGRCYIVYEFVEGESLAERIKPERIAADPLPHERAARIVAEVAEALHYAHLQEMFHRDIKPGNILLDRQGRPKVTDFGLAVHEQDLASQRGILAGTLPYMSPEQVRCEAHHIDGRTDIYSLGVVLYELLCGRRPFEAKTKDELEDQILHREAKPPRQIRDSIAPELERICLRALSKRISDRYTTAKDMAAELNQLPKGVCYPPRFDNRVEPAQQERDEAGEVSRGGAVTLLRRHVFISYARADRAIVERLVESLRRADIPTWVDDASVAPGTPDWEHAVRDRIRRAFAVVLICSPKTPDSTYVQAELQFAQSHKRAVVPVWITGNSWGDAVPLSLFTHEHIDAREARFQEGVDQLAARLCRIIDAQIPKLSAIESLSDCPPRVTPIVLPKSRESGLDLHRAKELGSFAELGGFRPRRADELRGLEMGDEMRSLLDEFLADEERARAGIRLEGNQVIAAKISAYPSVEGLLYDLYTSYLREIYEPFTYGKDWVLAKPHAMVTLLALPWQWLQHKRARRLMDVIPQYRTQVTPPGTICLHSESVWAVVDQGFEQACGLFTSSDQVAAEVSASPKYALSIMIDCHRAGRVFERGRIVSGVFPLDSLLPAEYRHKFVVVPSRSYLGDEQCQDAVYVI